MSHTYVLTSLTWQCPTGSFSVFVTKHSPIVFALYPLTSHRGWVKIAIASPICLNRVKSSLISQLNRSRKLVEFIKCSAIVCRNASKSPIFSISVFPCPLSATSYCFICDKRKFCIKWFVRKHGKLVPSIYNFKE